MGDEFTTRSVAASSYTSDTNEPRLAVLEKGAEIVFQRPLVGWGGSLVGTVVGDEDWKYIHVVLLDPLVETGIIGAAPFWLLFLLIVRNASRVASDTSIPWSLKAPLLSMFAAAFVEGLISGHVSGTK